MFIKHNYLNMDLTEEFKNFTDMNERIKIVEFLEELTEKFKNRQTTKEEDIRITEFYINELHEIFKNSNNNKDEKEYMKYFTMGWYIYENLLDKK
jgi:hypothetical protein